MSTEDVTKLIAVLQMQVEELRESESHNQSEIVENKELASSLRLSNYDTENKLKFTEKTLANVQADHIVTISSINKQHKNESLSAKNDVLTLSNEIASLNEHILNIKLVHRQDIDAVEHQRRQAFEKYQQLRQTHRDILRDLKNSRDEVLRRSEFNFWHK